MARSIKEFSEGLLRSPRSVREIRIENDYLENLRIQSRESLDSGANVIPIIFRNGTNIDSGLIEQINADPNLVNERIDILNDVINQNTPMNFINLINRTATSPLLFSTITDVFANPITNYQAYFPISNLMLIASTGFGDINEAVQFLISEFNIPTNGVTTEEASTSVSEHYRNAESTNVSNRDDSTNDIERDRSNREIERNARVILSRALTLNNLRRIATWATAGVTLYYGLPMVAPTLINTFSSLTGFNNIVRIDTPNSRNSSAIRSTDDSDTSFKDIVKTFVKWMKSFWVD
jgi:hypothetical protein